MAQKWVCDLVAQLLEEDGQGVYDYFLNRRTFLKSYYKDFDMRAFIGNKMNDIFNDPKNYDDATDRLTMQGKTQLRNEILTILENEQALMKKLQGQYDINSVSMFTRIEKWSQTPQSQWSVWEDNLMRGYEDVRGEVYFGLKGSLDTKLTLESGREAEFSADQMFEREDFKQAFLDLVVLGKERIENVDSAISGNIVKYNGNLKRYIASDKSIGDIDLAVAGLAYSPNKMVVTENGMELFGNIIQGTERKNFTSKEVHGAVSSFVEKNGHLFRSEGDAKRVGYMLLGRFDEAIIPTKEGKIMAQLNKTPQGKFRFFNRLVNQGYIDKAGLMEITTKYMDDTQNIYARLNNAMSTDLATTKMFGKKPFMALENARKIAETVLDTGEKGKFNTSIDRMDKLMNTMFNPGKLNTMDDKMFQLADLGASIIKANRITGAGLRTMGDGSLGGLKFSMFTGENFTASVLKGIGLTLTELEGKAIRNLGEGGKKIAPKNLADFIDNITGKLDFSAWANRMTEKERRKLTEKMLGTMADVITRTGMYDGTWTPLTEIASKKGFRKGGIKGMTTSWGSNFSMLQLKETVGNVLSWHFSQEFRAGLLKYEADPILAKYMDDLGFDKNARALYKRIGGMEEGTNLDLREVDWFAKKGKEYTEFMKEFFAPKNLDDLRPDQIGHILDTVAGMQGGDILKFNKAGVLEPESVAVVLEAMRTHFPKTFKKDINPNDFVINFKPDKHTAHVTITSDAFLKGGFAEDSDIRLALRTSYEIVREQEMRAIKEQAKLDFLKDGKVIPSKRKEVREMINELYGIVPQSDGSDATNFGYHSDRFVSEYYLDKFKDFERGIFYEFSSVKPSMQIRMIQDSLKSHDNRLGLIMSNSLAFKSASLDAVFKYKNLMGKFSGHMRQGKMFSAKKMGQYADAITAIGLIAFVNGIAGNLYDKATDKEKGDIVDVKDIARRGFADVVMFPTGVANPSVIQTSFGRAKQRPINEITKQMLLNDVNTNKFSKDLLAEMNRAYGLKRRKDKILLERKKRARKRAKSRGLVNELTGRIKSRSRK